MKHITTCLLFSLLLLKTNAQTLLNSYPSAAATIFLDFDGQTVAGTNWNYSGPIYCGPSGLNDAQITEVFNRVAEDYRPFNVNITTDSTRYWSAPVAQRMRVIVTVTSSWYGAVGGTSMVGTFTTGENTPCFVFSENLGYNTKKTGEAVSHEAGHTLGLYHQASYDASCNKTSDYNYGLGSGEIGWAPIMGAGYYQNLTLWNNGPKPDGCTVMQNDLQIITTTNGFTYRTDDHGNNFATATTIPLSANQFNASGVIERSTDMDLFKFMLSAPGRFQLGAVPYNVGSGNSGSDIDIQLTLYNSSQSVLNVYNPGSLLNSTVDSTLNAGTYYIKIEGRGNQYAPNYAVLGSYSVQAFFTPAAVLPLHKLLLTGSVNNNQHRLGWEIVADEQVVSQDLQASEDGIHFHSLSQPSSSTRSFNYTPSAAGALQYRLLVTFDNGNQYYSNIITMKTATGTPKPEMLGNLITTPGIVIVSPASYDYAIYGSNGTLFLKGQLKSGMNTIGVNALPAGMYIIRYTDPGHQWAEKFVRQ